MTSKTWLRFALVAFAATGLISCGGGGGGGLRNTMVVSATMSLIVSAAPVVTFTAAKITAACTRSETTVCPTDFLALGLDSMRFSNTQLPPREGQRGREAITGPIAWALPEDDNSVTTALAVATRPVVTTLVTLNEVKGAISSMVPFATLRVTAGEHSR